MALFKDIHNTYISYSGRRVIPNSRFKKCKSVFTIDITMEIAFVHHISNRVMFRKNNQTEPILSTDDIRWIIKKLYND